VRLSVLEEQFKHVMNENENPSLQGGKADDVEHFLRKLHRYLILCHVPVDMMVIYASHFLEGEVDKQ